MKTQEYRVKCDRGYNLSLEERNKLKFPGKVKLIKYGKVAENGEYCQIFSMGETKVNFIYNRLKGTFIKIEGDPEKVREIPQLLEKILGAKLEKIKNG